MYASYGYREDPVQCMASNDAAIAWTLQQDEMNRAHGTLPRHLPRGLHTPRITAAARPRPSRQSSWPSPSRRLSPAVQPRTDAEPAAAARQRVIERLSQYQLVERRIQGDGACQFRAIADQLWQDESKHALVRSNVCYQMYRHPELYREHIPSDYAAYCRSMQNLTTWGDHVTLQAAADAYGLRIMVLTSWRDSEVVEVVPRGACDSERVLYLSFWGGSHYNSVYQASVTEHKVLGSTRLGALQRLLFS